VADEVIGFGEAIPAFDYYTSVISLPGLLGFTVDNLPGNTPYLKATPARQAWPASAGKLKVGLVWAGSPTHRDDTNRSLLLALLAPVLAVPGVVFYSLQKPVPQRDLATLEKFPHLTLPGNLPDYLATASVVAEMDLVISVDTSVAHLAGALHQPVWNLVQFAPDWRWFAQFGERTPWYPTMRLFRQPSRDAWPAVIQQVARALADYVADPASVRRSV
jgi:hypothetical protein